MNGHSLPKCQGTQGSDNYVWDKSYNLIQQKLMPVTHSSPLIIRSILLDQVINVNVPMCDKLRRLLLQGEVLSIVNLTVRGNFKCLVLRLELIWELLPAYCLDFIYMCLNTLKECILKEYALRRSSVLFLIFFYNAEFVSNDKNILISMLSDCTQRICYPIFFYI